MESAKIAESDDLVWPNRKIVADDRPQKRDSHHDSRRLDPRSSFNCYCDSISSSVGKWAVAGERATKVKTAMESSAAERFEAPTYN